MFRFLSLTRALLVALWAATTFHESAISFCHGYGVSVIKSRATSTRLSAIQGNHEDDTRRNLLHSLPAAAAAMMMFPKPAAADLIQFPCSTLRNTYHLMRAGQSELEEQNMWGSNPLFLTNRENTLSSMGVAQVEEACQIMEEAQLDLSIVKFSLAANAMDSADRVASRLHVGHNNLVPEYTYMDQRGIGNWDMQPLDSTEEAVWAMDAREAGIDGWGGIPPPNDDGTANEMLGNQVTRLRQLLSLLESFASGDSILLIFPDGTSPALLSCLIAGIPVDRVHELNYKPGEVRLDVNYDTARSFLPATPSKDYQDALKKGRVQLEVLRSQDFISNKDQAYQAQLQQAEDEVAAWKVKKMKRQEEAERKRKDSYEADTDGSPTTIVRVDDNGIAQKPGRDAVGDKIANARAVFGLGLSIMGILAAGAEAGGETPKKKADTAASYTAVDDVPSEEVLKYQELEDMEELIESVPIIIPEFALPLDDIRNCNLSIKDDADDRMQLAERAMKEYLDRDDGSDVYLQFIGELMEGDE